MGRCRCRSSACLMIAPSSLKHINDYTAESILRTSLGLARSTRRGGVKRDVNSCTVTAADEARGERGRRHCLRPFYAIWHFGTLPPSLPSSALFSTARLLPLPVADCSPSGINVNRSRYKCKSHSIQHDVLHWPQMRFLSAELTTEEGSEGLSLFLFVERGVVLAVGRMTKAISTVIKRALLLRLLYRGLCGLVRRRP